MARIKEPIRQKVSQAFNFYIPPNQWEQYIDYFDEKGWSRKQMLTVLMILCQQVEYLESLMGGAQAQYTRLRTEKDIHDDLDKIYKEGVTTAFFVSSLDFKVLEKKLDPNKSRTDPQYGYQKELNPKTQREETCLLYRNLPVFRNK
jgi:hypothetical protein